MHSTTAQQKEIAIGALSPELVDLWLARAFNTTVSGDFALCRSQWRITGTDPHGKAIEIHHYGMEVIRRLPNGERVFFIDHPWGADAGRWDCVKKWLVE